MRAFDSWAWSFFTFSSNTWDVCKVILWGHRREEQKTREYYKGQRSGTGREFSTENEVEIARTALSARRCPEIRGRSGCVGETRVQRTVKGSFSLG